MHGKLLYWAVVLGVVLVPCSSACTNRSFEVNAYRGLAADQATYNEFVEIVAARSAAGELDEAQKQQAVELTRKWGQAHNEATEALGVYLRLKDPVSERKYLEAAMHLKDAALLVQQIMESWR